jgi:hypothetical protein
MLDTLANATLRAWPAVPSLIAMDGVSNTFPWGSVTATGVLVWYLWYTTCKANPRLFDQHQKQIAEQRQHYERILAEQQAAHMTEQKETRDVLASLSAAVEHLATK